MLRLHYFLKHNRRLIFQPVKEQRGLAVGLATRDFVKITSTNTVCHLCLSLDKPFLDEFEIQNLIIRITSEKLTKHPLSSLKFCSHCRSSQKYPLPAADSCFMYPEMELHQQSWSKKTSSRSGWSVSFVLSFGAAVHRLSGAPAITVGKIFRTIQVGLRSPKLSCSKMSNTYWKETPFWVIGGTCLCQRQCYTQANISLVSQEHLSEPCGCIGQRYRYIKLASALLPIIYVSAGLAHFFSLYIYLGVLRFFQLCTLLIFTVSWFRSINFSNCFVHLPRYNSLWE